MEYEYLECPNCHIGVTVDKCYEYAVGDSFTECPECGESSPDEDWAEYDTDFDFE